VKGKKALEKRSEETRKKLLSAATKLFTLHGYHKTTVNDIANEIGMTQGAFFHNFANKEELLYAVVERLARGFEEYRAVLGAANSTEALKELSTMMMAHYNNSPEATICLAALAAEFAGTGHPILQEILKAYDIFIDPFSDLLAGREGVDNPRASAIAFIGAFQGVAIQGLLRGGEISPDDLSNALAKLIGFK